MVFDNEMEKRKTDVREMQDKAFLMFEQAKNLVNENKKDEAISVYLELIKILNILRWSNVSKKIQDAIRELQSTPTPEPSTPVLQKETASVEKEVPPTTLQGHILSLKEFEMYKQQEETIQKEAFTLLDSGSASAKQKKFEKAIEDFNQAIILLNSIGWQSYTPQLQEEVDKFVQDQKHYNESLKKRMEKPETLSIEDLRTHRDNLQQEINSRKITVKEFEERKKIQYNYLIRASQLLEECEVSISILDYPEIYRVLQKSAQNLINVGWQEGVSKLTDFISRIKENQFQHELMEQQEHLAYIEKIRISSDIRTYFKNKMLEKEQEKATPFRRLEFTSVNSKTKSYEQQVYEVITEASKIPGTDDDSSKRKIELYNVAYHLVEKSQWADERVKVQSIVDILKKNLENRKKRIHTLEQNKIHTLSTLRAISERIKVHMKEFDLEKQAQKANLLKFQEKQQSIRSLENTAFKFIDIAKQSAKNLDFDTAIYNYNEAIEKFTNLGWTDQIYYLVQEVERIKKLKNQVLTDQQLKHELKKHEEQKKQVQLKAEQEREVQELQDLKDISEMISNVVKQKEIDEKLKQESQEEYRKNVEEPEEDKQIQEFKEMIRRASNKKSEE